MVFVRNAKLKQAIKAGNTKQHRKIVKHLYTNSLVTIYNNLCKEYKHRTPKGSFEDIPDKQYGVRRIYIHEGKEIPIHITPSR